MSKYRILLSGESNAWCQSLAITLEERSNFQIIDNVNSELLIETALRVQPDILIWKLEPDSYKAVLAEIKNQCPFTLVIVLVEDPGSINLLELIKCGVRACLPLRLFPRQISYAVELTAEAGIMCLPRPNLRDMHSEFIREQLPVIDSLSNREREVLGLLLDRLSNQEIAAALCLAESTVKTHLHNIFHKIGVHNRNEAYAKLVGNDKTETYRDLF